MIRLPVQEDELLLAQHHKDGVNQLRGLGEDEEPGPEAGDGHLSETKKQNLIRKTPFYFLLLTSLWKVLAQTEW